MACSKSLFVPLLDGEYVPCYGPHVYEIHSLAASAAISTIKNFVLEFTSGRVRKTLQNITLATNFSSINFDDQPITKLLQLKTFFSENEITTRHMRTLKCFLRLLVCEGSPKFIRGRCCNVCDAPYEVIHFAKFTITMKQCYGTKKNHVSRMSYKIDINYEDLCQTFDTSPNVPAVVSESSNDLDGIEHSRVILQPPEETWPAISESGPGPFKAQGWFDQKCDVSLKLDPSVNDFLSSLSTLTNTKITQTSTYISTACKLFMIFKHFDDVVTLSVTFVDLLLSWDVPMMIARSAWEWITTHCSSIFSAGFKAQIATGSSVKAITMLVTCLCSILGTTKLPSQKLIDIVLKRMGDVGRAANGYKSIIETFQSVFDKVYNVCYEFIFGVPPESTDVDVMMSDIREWYEEVAELTPFEKQDAIPVDYKFCRKIERIYSRGLEILRRLDTLRLTPYQKEPFMRYWMVVLKIYDRTITQGARKSEPRTEPVIIHLFGGSGVGKSGLVYLLSQDLCNVEGLADDSVNETYFRNVEQEYWDGYHGQMICVYDDFGQIQDQSGNPNPEFMEIIRSRNIAPWPLHMAHLEDKARTRFVSRACLLTSNHAQYAMPSLTCPDAFDRRLDLKALVDVKPQYCLPGTNRLDPAKAGKDLNEDVYRFNLYDGQTPRVDPLTGQPIWIDYKTFSQLAIVKYTEMYHASKRRLECLQQRCEVLKNVKLAAQVANEFEVTVDRAIQCNIWMAVQDDCYEKKIGSWLIDDDVLSVEQYEDLKIKACESDDYFEFMHEVIVYCLSRNINLTRTFKTTNNYTQYSDLIYDKNFTLAKRVRRPKLEYALFLFEQLSGNIKRLALDIKDTIAKHYIKFGAIAAALCAFYGLKKLNLFETITKKTHGKYKPKFIPIASPMLTESREQNKRPKNKPIVEKSKCESRSEDKRARRKNVAELIFSTNSSKCKCNYDAMMTPDLKQWFNNHIANPQYEKYDDVPCRFDFPCSFCLSQSNAWQEKSETLTLRKCEEHTRDEIVDDLIDALWLSYDGKAPLKTEAAIDVGSSEIRFGPIAINMYRVYTHTNGEWQARVNGIFVKGRLMLTAKHTKDWLQEDCCIRNGFNREGIYFKKSSCNFIPLYNSQGEEIDAMLIELPRDVNVHRSVLNLFSETTDLCKFTSVTGNLVLLKDIQYKGTSTTSSGHYFTPNIRAIDTTWYDYKDIDGSTRDLILRQGYIYDLETVPGDCGGVLCASNPGLPNKILGIHVAGCTGQGVAQVITRRILEAGLRKSSFEAQVALDVPFEGEPVLPDGNFMPVGKYGRVLPAPSKTELRESKLYKVVKDPSTKPANLRPILVDGEVVNPLMKGLKKCGVPNKPLDEIILRRCKAALTSFLRRDRLKSKLGILTLDEAIKGIDGDEFICPINRRSSAGIPWIFDRKGGTTGKRKWLGTDDNYILDHPDLIKSLNDRQEAAQRGERFLTIWADTLKDERRPIPKVDLGKTRVFSAGPMDYVVSMRMYFLPFFAHMMRQRIHNGCAVGINPISADWDLLSKKLRSKGRKVFAGDFENFDGTESAAILWACCDIINDIEHDDNDPCTDQHRRMRTVLFFEIVNSLHLYADNVYGWNHSLTSGNPGTAVINTMYNMLSMMYVWCLTTNLSCEDFFKHVYMIAYGDDNVVNVSDFICDTFNQITVSEGYKKIGMKYTDEDKTGKMVAWRDLDNVSFLKRKFRYDSSLCRYVAPLDLDTILEMTMWVRGDLDQDARCASNVAKAYEELSLHGYALFEQWTRVLDKLSHKHLDKPPILYDYLDYLGREFVC